MRTLFWSASFMLCGLCYSHSGAAQQIMNERVWRRSGLHLLSPTATLAPNGECLITAGVKPIGSTNGQLYSHLYVARLQTNCDTVWQRWMPHRVVVYATSAIATDAHSVWVLTDDTVYTTVSKGTRLWRFSPGGQFKGIVRPVPRLLPNRTVEQALTLLANPNGGCYAGVNSQSTLPGLHGLSLLRFDSTLTQRMRHDYPLSETNRLVKLLYTPNGNVLLSGGGWVNPTNGPSKIRLLEVDPVRGDSIRRVFVPAPSQFIDSQNNSNAEPRETIGLVGGGYAITTEFESYSGTPPTTGAVLRLDANYNLLWRYVRPRISSLYNQAVYTQVRELADGTLLALARSGNNPRAPFYLDRLDKTTGALIATYPVTSSLPGERIYANYLLPVATDSTLLIAGQAESTTGLPYGIYIARVRIPNLPRIVTAPVTFPTATRAEGSAVSIGLGQPYPNPSSSSVTFPYHLPVGTTQAQLELRDIVGRVVRTLPVNENETAVNVSVSDLPTGLYLGSLRVEGRVLATQRVAVVR